MGKRLFAILLAAALLFSALSGCSHASDVTSGEGGKDYPTKIGGVVFKQEPAGAAVLSPNIASVLLSIGYETSLKARSAACTQKDLSVLPVVTADDAQKIRDLGADVVFADSLTQEQKSAMEKAGLKVLTLKPAASREDLERLYIEVGSVLKGAKTGYQKGKDAADGLFETIDDITRAVPQSNTPVTAVYLFDAKGKGATDDMLAGKLVEAAGLTNSASGGKKGIVKAADLLIANPKYIFCAKGVKEQLSSSADYSKLSAVKANHVYEMDPGLMTRQGDELIQAVSFMAGTVHPELLSSSFSGSSQTQASQVSTDLNLNQTLQSGMQSDDVMKMQKRLEELGYMFVSPTGLYAEGTVQSVKDFQYLNGMTVTGVADPATLKKMFSSDAKKRPKQK